MSKLQCECGFEADKWQEIYDHECYPKGAKVYKCDCDRVFLTESDYNKHSCKQAPWYKGKNGKKSGPEQSEYWKTYQPALSSTHIETMPIVHVSHNHANWVKIGDYQVGVMGIYGKKLTADIKVYLDTMWLETGDILAGYRSRVGNVNAVIVKWPDRGVISTEKYKELVSYLVSQVRKGKKIAIGCHGGHGRTGTLLAGILAVIESLPAKDAIKELRKRYCDRVVETKEQEKLVESVY